MLKVFLIMSYLVKGFSALSLDSQAHLKQTVCIHHILPRA